VVLGTSSRGSGAPWRSELALELHIWLRFKVTYLTSPSMRHLLHFRFLRLQFKGNPFCGFENEYFAEGKTFLA
jgi:hypothetical protein